MSRKQSVFLPEQNHSSGQEGGQGWYVLLHFSLFFLTSNYPETKQSVGLLLISCLTWEIVYKSSNDCGGLNGTKIHLNDFVSFTPCGTCSNLSDEAVLQADGSIGDDEGDSSLHQYNKVSPTARHIVQLGRYHPDSLSRRREG